MLVLTRQVGDALIVGNDVYVKVLAVKGSVVHLGIGASPTVPVHHAEIYEQIRRRNLLEQRKKSDYTL